MKIPKKFIQHKPQRGGWSKWVYPLRKYLFQCCDCGLVHEIEFGTCLARNKRGKNFDVIELPEEIRVMFRARRK
jgi:hypothetical protein